MKRLILVLLPAFCFAQIEAPRLGVFVDSQNRLRSLLGLPGALLPGSVTADNVLSAAASQTHLVWKTADQLCTKESDRPAVCDPAPPGAAMVAFHPDGRPAVVEFAADSHIVAVSARYRVEDRAGALFRVAAADRSELPLPGLAPPALVFDDGTVIAAGAEALVLRTPGGEDRTLLDMAPSRLELLNRDLILLDRSRVLRLRDAAVFRLPREEDQP